MIEVGSRVIKMGRPLKETYIVTHMDGELCKIEVEGIDAAPFFVLKMIIKEIKGMMDGERA